MKVKWRVLAWMILTGLLPLYAQTYYVDAVSGSDENAGTSIERPWKSLYWVNKKVFSPGDKVLLKRGQVFKGPIELHGDGKEGSPIVLGAYGESEKRPVISTLRTHRFDWVKYKTNIWRASNGPGYDPNRLQLNGREILRANVLSEMNDRYKWGYIDGKLLLYSRENPSEASFRYSESKYGINCKSDYWVIRDIEVIGGRLRGIIIKDCEGVIVENVKVGDMADNGIWVVSNSAGKTKNIVLRNNIVDMNFDLNYFDAGNYKGSTQRGATEAIEVTFWVSGLEIYNNFIKNGQHANINLFASRGGWQEIKNVKIYNNELTAPDIPYGGRITIDGNCHHCEVFNNYIHDTATANQLNGHHNHYHHNVFENIINSPLHTSGRGRAIALQTYFAPVHDNVYENNIAINTEGNGLYIRGTYSNGYKIYNNVIRNNIFYNCGDPDTKNGSYPVLWMGAKGEVYNNVMRNNVIYHRKGKSTIRYDGTLMSIASFEGKMDGRFGNTIVENMAEDPKFMSVSGKNFHLRENSPVVDRGVKPKAMKDYAGNVIAAPYQVGLYNTIGGNESIMATSVSEEGEGKNQNTNKGPFVMDYSGLH